MMWEGSISIYFLVVSAFTIPGIGALVQSAKSYVQIACGKKRCDLNKVMHIPLHPRPVTFREVIIMQRAESKKSQYLCTTIG